MSDEYTRYLSEYLDGDLPHARSAAVSRHLSECAACQAVLADFRWIRDAARALRPPYLQRDLWPAINAAQFAHRARAYGADLRRGESTEYQTASRRSSGVAERYASTTRN